MLESVKLDNRSTPVLMAGHKEHKKDWWRELTSGEILQASLHLNPVHVRDAVSTTSDLGKSLGNSWRDIKHQIARITGLEALDHLVSPQTRQEISKIALTAATSIGFVAAGIQGIAGVVKLSHGFEGKRPLQRLEGWVDIATAGAIATTIGGLGPAAAVLGPLAAGLGALRGTTHALRGIQKGDSRRETQGWLDCTRSLAVMGKLLGSASAVAATAGAIFGPVAGVIQTTRGFIDVRDGLLEKSNTKEIQGLCDIGAAVGLTMAATGIGVIPGVAMTCLAVGARVLYQVSDRFENWTNRHLDRLEPHLEKAVHLVEKVTYPVIDAVRPLVKKVIDSIHPTPLPDS